MPRSPECYRGVQSQSGHLLPETRSTSSKPEKSYESEDSLLSRSTTPEVRDASISRPHTPVDDNEKPDRHVEDNPLMFRRAMVLVAMAFLWTTSQIPLYFYGGVQLNVLRDIGGWNEAIWLGLGQLIPLAIVTPFVGTLSDLFGRRNIGLAAFLFVIAGNIMCATAQTVNIYIPGTVFIGFGAGIGELISLAVAAEIAPTKNRGLYIGAIVSTILPFAPAVIYAQLVAYASTWRWIGLLIGLWSFIGFVLTFAFYWPPKSNPYSSRRELLRRIDWVGGFLSAGAICLVLVGFAFPFGGIPWSDPRVIACFVVGGCFTVGFTVWEYFFAKYPMFPARIKEKNPRVFAIILFITAVSGANFFAVMVYWPTQYQNVYAKDDPISMAIGSLPVSLGIIVGSMIVTALITILKGRIKFLMIASCVLMTAGNGTMAIASRNNLPVMWAVVSIACVGVGAVIVPNQVIAGIICPNDLLATITAITITIRIIAGTLGYAIYSTIFAMKFESIAENMIVPVILKMGITDPTEILQLVITMRGGGWDALPEFPGVVNQTQVDLLVSVGRDAQVASYPIVYYASIAFGAIAVVASCFLTGIEDQMEEGAAVKLM